MKSLTYFLVCCLLMVLIALLASDWLVIDVQASTSSPQLIINEIMYNPAGADSGHEWVEIINVSTSTNYAIDLDWRFNDGSNHQLSIILGDGIIEPNEYAVLVDNNEIFLQDYPDYAGSLIDTAMSLNNTEDALNLSADKGETFFADTAYQSAWGASNNGHSLERVDFTDAWQESLTASGTPGSLNQALDEETATSTAEELPEDDEETPTTTEEIIEEEQTPTTTEEVLEENNLNYSDLIVINEIMANPAGSDNHDEFVELYNRDSMEVDLSGWQLTDATDKKYAISSEDYQSTVIKPYGYFVVYRDQSGIALNNGGDKVKLYQPDDILLAEVEYIDSAEEGFSYSKNGGQFVWTSTPTPGAGNIISQPAQPISCPSPTVIYIEKAADEVNETEVEESKIDFDSSNYQGLRISELIPDPTGSDDFEWIEIANFGSKTLDLTGWELDDAEGGSWSFKLASGVKIEPNGYLVIAKEESKLALNNNGDEVRLISPDNTVFETVAYQSAEEGFSYNYDQLNNEWYWTDKISPGEKNIIGISNELTAGLETEGVGAGFPFKQIFEMRELNKGTKVKTAGIISSPPLALGKNIIYIADPAMPFSGIQLYSSSHDFLQFKMGDLIEVEGSISEIQGEKRINLEKDSEIKIIDNLSAAQPELMAIGDITDDLIGGLIHVSGELVERKGSDYYLDDGTGELRAYLKKDTGIAKPEVEEGYYLEMTGILSLTKSGYRLLPRFQADINAGQVLGEAEETKLSGEEIIIEAEDKQSKVKNVLSISGGSLLLLLASLIVKLKFLK